MWTSTTQLDARIKIEWVTASLTNNWLQRVTMHETASPKTFSNYKGYFFYGK